MTKAYIINLEKDVERFDHMANIMGQYDIDFERINAVDGRLIPKNTIENHTPTARGTSWAKSVGGYGCFMSHRLAWDAIANGADDWGLVLEDDMYLSDDFEAIIKDQKSLPTNADIIRLEPSTNRLKLRQARAFHSRKIYKVLSTSWCCGAYLIRKETARKLVATDETQWDYADYFLFCLETSPIANTLNIHQIIPAIAVQAKYHGDNIPEYFESNIGENKTNYFKEDISVLKNISNKIKKTIGRYKKVSFKKSV